MDLCLRGSQINLVSRKKPKNVNVQRPGSAFSHRLLSRSSPTLRRPMSADTRFVKSIDNCLDCTENILCENKLRRSKKYTNVNSSSDLFRLLLQEPIRRPWLCKDSENSSECSLGQKIYNIATKQREQMDSCGESSIEEDVPAASGEEPETKDDKTVTFQLDANEQPPDEPDNDADEAKEDEKEEAPPAQVLNNGKPLGPPSTDKDVWHETKSDLPGRVSFSKSDVYEADLSDGENELDATVDKPSTANKKTVHFRENIESPPRDEPPSSPQCNTKGCPCGKSNITSLISVEHKIENNSMPSTTKCYCKVSCNSSSCYSSFIESKTQTTSKMSFFSMGKNSDTFFGSSKSEDGNQGNCEEPEAAETNQDNDRSPDSSANFFHKFEKKYEESKNIPMERKKEDEAELQGSKFTSFLMTKYGSGVLDLKSSSENVSKASESPRREDDLMQSMNLNKGRTSKDTEKQFLFDERMFEIKKFQNDYQEELTMMEVSGNRMVMNNNFLRTMDHRKDTGRKQSNLIGNKSDPSKPINGSRRPKSATPDRSKKPKPKAKKPQTPSCAREKSNLDEFQMDKVDSWMSLHEPMSGVKNAVEENETKDTNLIQETSPPSSARPQEEEMNISSKSSEFSNDDSTYEEIVSVIKEIEEDRKKEEASDGKSDISFKLHALLGSIETPVSSPTTKERNESNDKFQDILNYLDDVETTCEKTLMETRRSIPESTRSEIEFSIEPDIIEDVPKVADLVILPNHQLARRIVSLSLRANELSNALQLSREHVSHIRAEKQKAIRQEKTNATNRLKDQKAHFENMVVRHQNFIEQLLKDKSALCEKVSNLTRRIESQNQAWEHKLTAEAARIKEACLAGEKIRRERWVRENTKKIKQLTVKGIESEINKMTNEHMQEINDLKRRHQQELLDAAEEARLKHENTEKFIRESCAKDRESIIAKERAAIRERFEQHLHEEQMSYEEQKNKLLDEFAMERERLYAEIRQKDMECEEKCQQLLKEKDRAVAQVRAEFNEKLQRQEQKYEARLSSTVQQFESDFLIWKRDYENSCKLREAENENDIRQHYRSERDRQIDAIVEKMDTESLKAQEEYETKINRLKAKHESDLREAESLEKNLKQKCNELRNKLAESDGRVQNLEADIKQMKIELEHSKKMCNEFLAEKEDMKENARKEIQNEVKALQAERDNEIQQIYKRVQQAIEKKDASMEMLQKDNAALRERCVKMEAVIRQQRKDYCIK